MTRRFKRALAVTVSFALGSTAALADNYSDPAQSQPQPQAQSQTQTQTTQSQTTQTKVKRGERSMQNVYFDTDSDVPKGDLLLVANNLECTPNDTIVLDGFADPRGSAEHNADLSKRRAQAVKNKLVAMGIDGDRILIGVFGENGTRNPTLAEDRRVEVRSSDEPVAAITARRSGAVAVIDNSGENVEQVATP
jgi:outer membrane protein OmpA-like peptidoglycan-associated protein